MPVNLRLSRHIASRSMVTLLRRRRMLSGCVSLHEPTCGRVEEVYAIQFKMEVHSEGQGTLMMIVVAIVVEGMKDGNE